MKDVLKKYLVPHEGNTYKPHIFHRKSTLALALFSFALFLVTLAYSAILPRIDYLAAVLPSVLVDLANQDRTIYNLNPLTPNPVLEAAAREKAEDMARYGYFAHISPTGITPWYWITRAGYRFIYAGENLAVNFLDSSEVNKAWMDSATHRANILNQNFTEIGIATVPGFYQGHPTTFVVQMFGRPAFAPSGATAGKPASVAAAEPETEPLEETETFIAVRNKEEQLAPQTAVVGTTQYATLPAKVLSSPGTLLHLVYTVILAVVLLAIVLSLAIELRRHHGKHLLSGILVVGFVIALSYLYQFISAGLVV